MKDSHPEGVWMRAWCIHLNLSLNLLAEASRFLAEVVVVGRGFLYSRHFFTKHHAVHGQNVLFLSLQFECSLDHFPQEELLFVSHSKLALSYQMGSVKAVRCFYWDMRIQPTASFLTAAPVASRGSWTHSDDSAVYPLLHTVHNLTDSLDWLVIDSMPLQPNEHGQLHEEHQRDSNSWQYLKQTLMRCLRSTRYNRRGVGLMGPSWNLTRIL